MEEDIKILEEYIKEWHDTNIAYHVENLIKGYRELEESNKILQDAYWNECVPKSKIKEKIEELEKYIYKGENAPQDFLQYRIKAKIRVLEELMEDK